MMSGHDVALRRTDGQSSGVRSVSVRATTALAARRRAIGQFPAGYLHRLGGLRGSLRTSRSVSAGRLVDDAPTAAKWVAGVRSSRRRRPLISSHAHRRDVCSRALCPNTGQTALPLRQLPGSDSRSPRGCGAASRRLLRGLPLGADLHRADRGGRHESIAAMAVLAVVILSRRCGSGRPFSASVGPLLAAVLAPWSPWLLPSNT